MGTHPIFESDFDCLTGLTGLRKIYFKYWLSQSNGNVRNSQIGIKINEETANVNTPCRFISQQGKCMVRNVNTNKWFHYHYLSDILTTCIDLQWRYTLLIFVLLYVASWLLFGIIYYVISYVHKDFPELYLVNGTDPEIANMTEQCLEYRGSNCLKSDVGILDNSSCELKSILRKECDVASFDQVRDCFDQVNKYKLDRDEDTCFTTITN